MKEEWKVINNHENFAVSNAGRIRNLLTGHIKNVEENTAGYLRVSLGRHKYFVHRLVAEHFVDGYFEGAVVNHKDFDKHNNISTNLEWCSRSHNSKHAHAGGHQPGSFIAKKRNILYKGLLCCDITVKDFCRMTGICKSSFYNYVNDGTISYVSNDYCESKYTEACGNGESSESC